MRVDRRWNRLSLIVCAVAAAWFAAFAADRAAPTRLLSPLGASFYVLVGFLAVTTGIALGLIMAAQVQRGSRALAVLAVPTCTVLFLVFTGPLAARAANIWLFAGAQTVRERVLYGITGIGIDRGGPYALVSDKYAHANDITDRLPISMGDHQAMLLSRSTERRYCLPILLERSGKAVRFYPPARPRPSEAGRLTITPCR